MAPRGIRYGSMWWVGLCVCLAVTRVKGQATFIYVRDMSMHMHCLARYLMAIAKWFGTTVKMGFSQRAKQIKNKVPRSYGRMGERAVHVNWPQ
ncbi:hypothetical protein BGY98DRAFT_747532 [Russula aff. rugulosa BPL654]|nr:hypothetical protein BGY98DRAFT_747532 [Russula aff. rugulosa BPL654]